MEELAYRYINLSEVQLTLIGIAVTALGGVIAGLTRRAGYSLARIPYFAYSSLIFFLVSAIQIVWLQSIPAMVAEILWVLMTISLLSALIAGFFIIELAMARSRDAVGHGRMAFLAFVPFGALWLLFAPPQNQPEQGPSTIAALRGTAGVILGLALYIGGFAVSAYIPNAVVRAAESVENDPAAQMATMSMLLQTNGLEAALEIMAAEAPTPMTVDETTTLQNIEADRNRLLRTYVVDAKITSLTPNLEDQVQGAVCAFEPFQALFDGGATIVEIYVRSDGAALGEFAIDGETCGARSR